ncbi:hypothetical protein JXB02_00580 [Candidatus Woesearchaeota archaeon]|nr:hypothetical protein [Candidatus Woesearchaeota archaeon]
MVRTAMSAHALMIVLFALVLIMLGEALRPSRVGTEAPLVIVPLFCRADPCGETLDALIAGAHETRCALFDLDPDVLPSLISPTGDASIAVIVDARNRFDGAPDHVRFVRGEGYLHDKFCVLDRRIVVTGSMNPTVRGVAENDNNLVLIDDPRLAALYLDEFAELWGGTVGGGTPSMASLSYADATVSVAFCPEDRCRDLLLSRLSRAEESIRFMLFSFTDEEVARLLVRAAQDGLTVEGIVEKIQASTSGAVALLRANGIPVLDDANPAFMHHKVFIIDSKAIVFGSYNPSRRAAEINDENLVVLEHRPTADRFGEEWLRIYGTVSDGGRKKG